MYVSSLSLPGQVACRYPSITLTPTSSIQSSIQQYWRPVSLAYPSNANNVLIQVLIQLRGRTEGKGALTALTTMTIAPCGAFIWISILTSRTKVAIFNDFTAVNRKLDAVSATAKHCSCFSSFRFMVAFGRRANFLCRSSTKT